MSIEAMKQALMQLNRDDVYLGHRSKTRADAITALRQAIAEAEKREWVGLTDEEIKDIREDLTYDDEDFNQLEFARDIEAKLKKKNVPQP